MNNEIVFDQIGHLHTGSLDWISCPVCNPNFKSDEPEIFVQDCINCGKQFVSDGKKEEVCDKCKNKGGSWEMK